MARIGGKISETFMRIMCAQNILASPPIWGLSITVSEKKKS